MTGASTGWQQARNILCVRLDAMGDVLMTSPAIRAVKESLPGSRITLLTSTRGAEAAALLPEVDDRLVFDPVWMKATEPRQDSQPEMELIQTLMTGGFDGAIIFTVFSQNPLPAALTCFLANIPLRAAHCRENPYQLLTNWVKEIEPEQMIRHEVERQLAMVGALGLTTHNKKLGLRIANKDKAGVSSNLRDADVDLAKPWLVIHPGSSAPSRRYPPELYAEVARRLALEDGFQIVFTGTAAESDLIEGIRSHMRVPSVSLAGRLNLGQLAALLILAPLLVANNTGPVHIAAAVGTPVVDLYALTNPQHTPWGVPNRVLSYDVPCKYCYKSICPLEHNNCLRMIDPGNVIEAVRDLYAETNQVVSDQPVSAL